MAIGDKQPVSRVKRLKVEVKAKAERNIREGSNAFDMNPSV
jgi:hypothetical protein